MMMTRKKKKKPNQEQKKRKEEEQIKLSKKTILELGRKLANLGNIPKQLVVDNNIQLSSELILRDQTRRSWPVTTRFTSDGRYWITKGWHDFCVGNNIQENDYFTFEFLQGKGFSRTVIDVHITRPTCKVFNGA
ncbi:hypothetical protein IFM89_030784 [Coptis chinensis]|uniref:TF-B3 domain-containing protein n=1 Tax=Coptis chinensis TaxID=261450 RepID=A0A835M2H8_9MAGN|nr:hypothetical protein IFM89_030784 [Coptis chinensis]